VVSLWVKTIELLIRLKSKLSEALMSSVCLSNALGSVDFFKVGCCGNRAVNIFILKKNFASWKLLPLIIIFHI